MLFSSLFSCDVFSLVKQSSGCAGKTSVKTGRFRKKKKKKKKKKTRVFGDDCGPEGHG